MEAAAPNSGDHNRRRLCWTKHFPKTGFSERVPILGLCRTSASRTSSSAARSRAANHLRPGDTETLKRGCADVMISLTITVNGAVCPFRVVPSVQLRRS